MSDSRKKRLSMLDNMAAAAASPPPPSGMSNNRALRAARDAVDGHSVWDLDPALIDDDRPRDRLDPYDVTDLRDAIEQNGQTVPILVRRHPKDDTRYLLVYGRRRLEAIRDSKKVSTVRALIATLDDDAAVRAQVSENMARRDLTYIEKALFAHGLIDAGFGTQQQVAEVLTVAKSSISMALAVVEMVGNDLARSIGPAEGIGRPRWDALAKGVERTLLSHETLIDIAEKARSQAIAKLFESTTQDEIEDPSIAAFEAVFEAVKPAIPVPKKAKKRAPKARIQVLEVGAGVGKAELRRTPQGLQVKVADGAFADWLEHEAADVLKELHARWRNRAED